MGLFTPSQGKRIAFFLISDILLIALSLFLSFLFHFDFNLKVDYPGLLEEVLLFFCLLKLIPFVLFRVYRMTWRYVGINDLVNVVLALVLSELALIVLSLPTPLLPTLSITGMPKRIFLVDGIISLCLISGVRISKRIYLEIIRKKGPGRKGKRTIILGAGNTGDMMLRDMARNNFNEFYPVGMLDDDKTKVGTYIHGIKVLGATDTLEDAVVKYGIEAVIVAIPSLNHKSLREMYNSARKMKIEDIKIVPRIYDFDRPDINLKTLEEISIEDIIGRQSIAVDYRGIKNFVNERAIMVTGAGGSIGSEIIIQVCSFNPRKVILFDIDETELHNLGLRLKRLFPHLSSDTHYVTGDVRDEIRLREVLDEHRPQILFHAAAYKHVPMMEYNPKEAVKVNMFGTYLLAKTSLKYGLEKFIMISTDKAVRPTSIMGASKRMAEHICKAFNGSLQTSDSGPQEAAETGSTDPSSITDRSSTRFISVRFGNVLGSRGSVLPLFLDQLKHGGPITLTHKDMLRYFMTIPEAVSLVLQASTMGEGGEVFVLDMGEPVKIVELAEELIRIHGLEPYKDIDIETIGLRPGEKLFEEILTAEEGTIASRHERVYVARDSEKYSLEEMESILEEFRALLSDSEKGDLRVRELLKKYVKHYEGVHEDKQQV
jgi:FlaA1/EpsC-like NDP-sugar epimerase